MERRQITLERAEGSLSPPICPSTSMMRAGMVLNNDDNDDEDDDYDDDDDDDDDDDKG